MNCSACGKKISQKALNQRYLNIVGVYECQHCKAVLGQCYKGESYQIVKPWMHANPNVPLENWRHFDLTVLGSNGIERRHGWFDVDSRLVVQIG